MKSFDTFSKNKDKNALIRFELKNADSCPNDLPEQLPIRISVLRQMPGPDTSNYWLAKCDAPVRWNERDRDINYLIVGCRFVGVEMKKGIGEIALNVAYVTDESILKDRKTNFEKCAYVAICMAEEIE